MALTYLQETEGPAPYQLGHPAKFPLHRFMSDKEKYNMRANFVPGSGQAGKNVRPTPSAKPSPPFAASSQSQTHLTGTLGALSGPSSSNLLAPRQGTLFNDNPGLIAEKLLQCACPSRRVEIVDLPRGSYNQLVELLSAVGDVEQSPQLEASDVLSVQFYDSRAARKLAASLSSPPFAGASLRSVILETDVAAVIDVPWGASVDLGQLRNVLGRLGDISSLTSCRPLVGGPQQVICSFYDVRVARKMQQQLITVDGVQLRASAASVPHYHTTPITPGGTAETIGNTSSVLDKAPGRLPGSLAFGAGPGSISPPLSSGLTPPSTASIPPAGSPFMQARSEIPSPFFAGTEGGRLGGHTVDLGPTRVDNPATKTHRISHHIHGAHHSSHHHPTHQHPASHSGSSSGSTYLSPSLSHQATNPSMPSPSFLANRSPVSHASLSDPSEFLDKMQPRAKALSCSQLEQKSSDLLHGSFGPIGSGSAVGSGSAIDSSSTIGGGNVTSGRLFESVLQGGPLSRSRSHDTPAPIGAGYPLVTGPRPKVERGPVSTAEKSGIVTSDSGPAGGAGKRRTTKSEQSAAKERVDFKDSKETKELKEPKESKESKESKETKDSRSSEPGNDIDLKAIANGSETRTTVMLRNIPNKLDFKDLKKFLDVTNRCTYDFLYLRFDFVNRCNVGYAFISFTKPKHVALLVKARAGMSWSQYNYNSEKIIEIKYARIQGRDSLIQKFRNSPVMSQDPAFKPRLYYTKGKLSGKEEPFPEPSEKS